MRNFSLSLLCGLLLINLITCSVIVRNPGCNAYDGQGICTSCSVRFYKDPNNICQPVNPNCNTYNSVTGDCLSCYPGWGLLEGTCLPGLTDTVTFDPNCNTFNGSTCVKCSFGYYFGQDGSCTKVDSSCQTFNETTGQCLTCFSGFALSSGKCNPQAAQPIDPNCNQFDSNNVCIKCSSGYYFSSGSCKKIDDSCKTFDYQKLNCAECYSGYALSTDFQCVKEAPKDNTNPLCSQWNNTQCVKCSKGSTFDQQGACVLLDSYCKSYDNITGKCIKCYSGYVIGSNGTCQVDNSQNVSDPNCYSFGGNGQCSKCSTGYYFNSLKVCVKIDDSCKAFSVSQNKCMECYPGYQLGSGGECLVANVGLTDVNCAQWNQTVCLKCSLGSAFDKNGKCITLDPQCQSYDSSTNQCKSCYPGYALDSNFKCAESTQEVTDVLCAQWQGNICLKCAFGSYFNSQGVCTQSDASCKSSDSTTGVCIDCYSGYELSANKTCVKSTAAIDTNSLCSEWDSTALICLTCSSGSFFNNLGLCQAFDPLCKTSNQTNGFCTSCYNGYSVDTNGKCVPSQDSSRDPNCAVFNSDNTCQNCSKGYFFDTNTKLCQLANPLCKTIDSTNGACLSCYSGYAVNGTQCIIDQNSASSLCAELVDGICVQCASRTFLNSSGECQAVSQDCRTYSDIDGKCLSCYIGFSLSNGICTKSDTKTGCSSFDSNGQCTKCSAGYYLTSTCECTQIDPQCANFNSQTNKCEGCYSGYTLLADKCEISKVNDQFEVKNCIAYNSDNNCIQCFDRFYLSNNQCKDVNVFCKTYDLISGLCTGCYTSFKLNNGQCTK